MARVFPQELPLVLVQDGVESVFHNLLDYYWHVGDVPGSGEDSFPGLTVFGNVRLRDPPFRKIKDRPRKESPDIMFERQVPVSATRRSVTSLTRDLLGKTAVKKLTEKPDEAPFMK